MTNLPAGVAELCWTGTQAIGTLQDPLCLWCALRYCSVKINLDDTVRPYKYSDRDMRSEIGLAIGQGSPEDAQSIYLWSLEGRFAAELVSDWGNWVDYLEAELRSNKKTLADWRADPHVAPVLGDVELLMNEYIAKLARERDFTLLQRTLCQEVLEALRTELGSVFVGRYDGSGQGSASPALRLQGQRLLMAGVHRRDAAEHERLLQEVDRLVEIRDRRTSYRDSDRAVPLTRLDCMNASPEFESQIARLLRRDGCLIEREHGFPGDKNADVIAISPDRGHRIVVQVKQRSTKNIDERTLWELNGTAWDLHKADITALVTNSYFSTEARTFATQLGINLIDRDALELCASYGEPLLPLLQIAPRRRETAMLQAA